MNNAKSNSNKTATLFVLDGHIHWSEIMASSKRPKVGQKVQLFVGGWGALQPCPRKCETCATEEAPKATFLITGEHLFEDQSDDVDAFDLASQLPLLNNPQNEDGSHIFDSWTLMGYARVRPDKKGRPKKVAVLEIELAG